MKLEKIHLGGFKSFAEVVSVELKNQMTGIVGPNGCGKSNIVDAIRWVMGETSRHIRATNLEDVIFSGTTSRKPVGQAFVELIFDNSDGKSGAQYAQYSEISLRRTVSRNRESKYYINGSRCRRKDIADIFFGTGLGTNSYAIIEQGMISRIIEAKPEEMRSYIEEAAGVSKYRERRKETENRIRRTRENLERVMDIREEIDKQLRKLKKQVREAERYKRLRSEKETCKAGLMLMQLRSCDTEQQAAKKALDEKRMRLDQGEASTQVAEAKLEQQRLDLEEANNALHAAKEVLYRLDAKAAALEREIATQQKSTEQIQQEQQEIQATLQDISTELKSEQEKCVAFEKRAAELQVSCEQLTSDVAAGQEVVEGVESELEKLYVLRDQHHSDSRESSEKLKVEKVRSELYQQSLLEIDKSESEIASQRQGIDLVLLETEKAENAHRLKRNRQEAEQGQQAIDGAVASIKQLRERAHSINEKLNEGQAQVQEVQGQISSLKVLQEAALGHDAEAFNSWLSEAGLSDKSLVSEGITVEQGWENAVEIVLGTFLEGVKIDALDNQIRRLDSFNQGTLVLLESGEQAGATGRDTLADKVSSDSGLHSQLSQVLVADNIADAMAKRNSLRAGESVVTRDGIWVGKNWLQLRRFSQSDEGVLIRKTKISSLRKRLDDLLNSVSAVKYELEQVHTDLSAQEIMRDQEQEQQLVYLKQITVLESSIAHGDEQIAQQGTQLEKLDQMQQDIASRRGQLISEHQQSQQEHDKAWAEVQKMGTRFDNLAEHIVQQETALAEKRSLLHQMREALHQAEIETESVRVNLTASERHAAQSQRQTESLQQRQIILQESMSGLDTPLSESRTQHEQLLKERFTADETLANANQSVLAVQAKMGELENERDQLRAQLNMLREANEESRATLEVSIARHKDAQESFAKLAVNVAEIEASLPEGVTIKEQEEALQQVQVKLGRLGAINLVALEEFNELSERKTLIDSQYEDLTSALDTLEAAIKKIDHETKTRFKETFESINENLRKLFPALFGGGEAYLEMTESDLLNAGITVMAKPPGKRLSSIQLMSGGEKALAAAAVVFSIFELNPAPFCILDEVDAPLDEHNIERFCDMIKEMSNRVQFIIITHNKLSMEYMDCLIGITMYEAGISRLVSVDMDEALEMAST